MKVEKVSAYAEIISSLAIVLTLIYLALQTQQMNVQTQQTNNILLSNSRQAALASDIAIIGLVVDHPEAMTNLQSDEELTTHEVNQVRALLSGLIRTREFEWIQYKAGILDEDTWESYIQVFVGLLRGNGNATNNWKLVSEGLNPEFIEEIISRLETNAD